MAESKIPENPPAFPDSVAVDHMDGLNFSRNQGLAMRDYFAASVLAGLGGDIFSLESGTIAARAYAIANAMLVERAKGGK